MQDHDCSRGPQMPQSENEKNKTQAIAEKTYHTCDQEKRTCRQARAGPQTKRQVEWTSDQAFQLDDLERVGERHLAREVVVEPPGNTGSGNGERPDESRQ